MVLSISSALNMNPQSGNRLNKPYVIAVQCSGEVEDNGQGTMRFQSWVKVYSQVYSKNVFRCLSSTGSQCQWA